MPGCLNTGIVRRFIPPNAAVWRAFGGRDTRHDDIRFAFEHNGFAVVKNHVMVSLAGCGSNREIPTPHCFAIVVSGRKYSVPGVVETRRLYQSVNRFLFPCTAVVARLLADLQIGVRDTHSGRDGGHRFIDLGA